MNKINIFILFLLLQLLCLPTFSFFLSAQSAEGEKVKTGEPFSQVKFLPSISLILDFSWESRNLDNVLFQSLEMPGFSSHGHHDGHEHSAHGGAENGFNLNYGEMVMSASVDPYFDIMAAFHLSEEGFAMEEAYIVTRTLPWGVGVKLGRFLSAFGRVNSQHAHLWEFNDIPLPHRVFFGAEGLADKGVQVNWTAPTPFYLSLGVEALQGSGGVSFSGQPFDVIDHDSGELNSFGEPGAPNTWVFFCKSSADMGDLVLLGGASAAFGKARFDLLEDEHAPSAFSGNTFMFGFDLYARYTIDSYRYFSIQGEYLSRVTDGWNFIAPGDHHDHHDHLSGTGLLLQSPAEPELEKIAEERSQAGFYAQAIYRFLPRWRIGARFELLHRNDIVRNGESLSLPGDLKRWSFMLELKPSEFSRLRLQYRLDHASWLEGELKKFHVLSLQFNFAIGAHGAHTF